MYTIQKGAGLVKVIKERKMKPLNVSINNASSRMAHDKSRGSQNPQQSVQQMNDNQMFGGYEISPLSPRERQEDDSEMLPRKTADFGMKKQLQTNVPNTQEPLRIKGNKMSE